MEPIAGVGVEKVTDRTEGFPMIRRLLIPLLGSGLLLAGTATGVLAKCEGPNPPPQCSDVVASMNIGGSAGTFTADTQKSVVVSVSQGELPFDAAGVAITFSHLGDTKVYRVQTTSTGQPGMWRADVTLPTSGIWTVVAAIVTVDGNAYSAPMETIQVAKAPQAPPATTPTPPASPTPPVLPIALLLAGLAAAALLATGMRERSRRRTAGAGAAMGAATARANAANTDRT
jgi:hypothetical protein